MPVIKISLKPEKMLTLFMMSCILCFLIILTIPMAVLAAADYGPGYPMSGDASYMNSVTIDMLSPDAWTVNPEYRKVLLTPAEINRFNQRNFETADTNMVLLSEEPQTFNGIQMKEELAAFPVPDGLYLHSSPVPESYYTAIRKNIADASASEVMQTGYGIVINRTVMKSLPYSDYLSDSKEDPEWDNLCLSALLVNEPVLIYLTTADCKFIYVKSEIYYGWVSAEDIAVCRSREEWLSASTHTNFLVITGESVSTEASSADNSHSEKAFDMGTVLELDNGTQFVDNRMSWYNYVVNIPAKGADGLYQTKKGLIPVNRDVHVGYLPFTEESLITQAMKCLGNRYGWGGMLDSQDCSSFIRELYLCFGMKLPRNTTWQAKMPVKMIDLSEKTDTEKLSVLSTTAPGSILQFHGHEMLYLGTKNGKSYTINDVSSLCLDGSGSSGKYRVRSVIINSLEDTWRANGKTWLSSLSGIIIPWESGT